jgi:hypothetical protein
LNRKLKAVKYLNGSNYSVIADKILKRMGEMNFQILWIQSAKDYFILPDCTAWFKRATLKDNFNPDLSELVSIGIPITSKIFILVTTNRFIKEDCKIFRMHNDSANVIFHMNRFLFDSADKAVACESKDYLEGFIKKLNWHE